MATLVRTLTGQSSKSTTSRKSSDLDTRNYNLQRTATNDPWFGHLNHLNPDQVDRLDQFKARLEKGGWWTPDGVNGKPSHDDGTLLRYLRARKFDIAGAIGQFTDTEKWIKEQRVEELYEHFDVEFYERARALYPQWTGRRDKRGIPIYVFEIKGLDSKNVSKYQKESEAYKDKLPNHKKSSTPAKLLPLFALYSNLTNMVLPLCSALDRPNPEVPVTNSTNIVDISGVGLTQFWNLKQHMQDASVLATAHYPETLDRIFIIGAPAFFPTVWGWIKRWFDPVTVSKIFILGRNEVKPTLESFMDMKNVPKKYGGEMEWGWGDQPDLGEAERKAVEVDGDSGWIPGPCVFYNRQRFVVGSENGKDRGDQEEVNKNKPVFYAADYTREPVHSDKGASRATKTHETQTNGTAVAPTISDVPPTTKDPKPEVVDETKAAPTLAPPNPNLNVHISPAGDSEVHLPKNQPAPPAITAEYISPQIKPMNDDFAYREPERPTTTAKSSAPRIDQALHSNPVDVIPPAGHIEPGPISQHAIAVNQQIAHSLEGESVSTIPAQANGKLAHPEMTVASDASKGLAIETDKLDLNGSAEKEGTTERPTIERFVTAAQF